MKNLDQNTLHVIDEPEAVPDVTYRALDIALMSEENRERRNGEDDESFRKSVSIIRC